MKKELIRSLIAINHSTCASNINRLTQNSSVARTTTVGALAHHAHWHVTLAFQISLAVADTRLALSADDWSRLTHIRNAYDEHCVQPFLLSHQTIPLIVTAQPYRARFKLQRLIDLKQKYTSVLTSFIRRILQYDPLREVYVDDIKENFKLLLTLNTTELMKSGALDQVPWENDRLLFESILTENLMQRLESNLRRYQTMSPYDPVMMKLFLIILALATGISPLMKKTHYDTRDFQAKPNSIHLSQNFYLTLLWKYVTHRLDQREAVNYSVRFIQNFLHRQSLEVEMMDVVESRNDHGQFAESLQAATNL